MARYETRVGKFGSYFFDKVDQVELTLDEVTFRLNAASCTAAELAQLRHKISVENKEADKTSNNKR